MVAKLSMPRPTDPPLDRSVILLDDVVPVLVLAQPHVRKGMNQASSPARGQTGAGRPSWLTGWSSPARCAAELFPPAPKAGLAAVPRPQPRHERLVRLEPAV